MPRNKNKRTCSLAGCNAWAMRASSPPFCASHSGRTGAPEGNQNRLVHGFYATTVHPDECDDLAAQPGDATLASQIAITRIALRRIFAILVTGQTPGVHPRPLVAQDYACYAGLAFQAASRISRLIRANQAILDSSSGIPEPIETAFDELGDRREVRRRTACCAAISALPGRDIVPMPMLNLRKSSRWRALGLAALRSQGASATTRWKGPGPRQKATAHEDWQSSRPAACPRASAARPVGCLDPVYVSMRPSLT